MHIPTKTYKLNNLYYLFMTYYIICKLCNTCIEHKKRYTSITKIKKHLNSHHRNIASQRLYYITKDKDIRDKIQHHLNIIKTYQDIYNDFSRIEKQFIQTKTQELINEIKPYLMINNNKI